MATGQHIEMFISMYRSQSTCKEDFILYDIMPGDNKYIILFNKSCHTYIYCKRILHY